MKEEIFECDACHRQFKSAKSLNSHYRFCKVGTHVTKPMKSSKYKISDNCYLCECGKTFLSALSLNAHFSYCLKHKEAIGVEVKVAESKIRNGDKCNFSKEYLGDEAFNEIHKKAGKAFHEKIQAGELVPIWKDRHHTEETKEKIRKSTIKYVTMTIGSRPRYNKSAIPILEQIAKEHGWNIQHAENGGEFYTGIGYFVDAYDKEKNIVLEYDEPAHYVDAENNVLRLKDLDRQQRIIDHLHCEYWRFNEVIQKLWKVSLQQT